MELQMLYMFRWLEINLLWILYMDLWSNIFLKKEFQGAYLQYEDAILPV